MLRSACVMCIFCFSLSCLSVFLFAPLLGRCLLADSTANHHSYVMIVCQSAGVPAVFEDASWLCVGAPCQRTLCANSLCGQQFVFDTNSLPMLNVSCLMSHALCCAIWSIYRSVPCLLTCIEFCVEDNADARIGVSVLLCQVQSKVHVGASG